MSNYSALIEFLINITANNNELAIRKYLKYKYSQAILHYTYKGIDVYECKKNSWTKYKYSLICLAIDVFNRYISENETSNGENINYVILRDMFQNRIKEILPVMLNNIDIDLITNLSYEKYEKNNVKNAVIVLPIDYSSLLISFDKNHQYKFASQNIHGIRKLIQMLDDDHCLVMHKKTTDYYAVGIVQAKKTRKLMRCELRALGEWTVRIPIVNADPKIKDPFSDFLQYKKSQYWICNPLECTDIKEMLSICDIEKKYRILPDSNILNHMSLLIHRIVKSGYGTIIIFSKNRKDFDNLKKYKRMFLSKKSLKKNMKIIDNLVQIDGAIICDFDCQLIGYGAILDGGAIEYANLQRGSRYNSTLNFIRHHENTSFGVVISDDGMIDIISKK